MNNGKFKFKERLAEFRSQYGFLLGAFVIPMLIMWMIYIAMEVWPFGNSSVLVLDLNGQYVYFFEDLRKKVLEGGSFLYTWTRSMGGEFMGIYAYYLASPFSFLIALFSNEHITEGLLLIILLKVGSMGATMAYYLKKSHPSKNLNILIFSTCYALSGYAVVMAHNTMWIDNLILLPLVTLGIERLITKREFKLFVFSLAMALLTSFYIGYMMCLYVAIYFFYYYLAHDNHFENNFWMEDNHFWRSFGRIVLYSGIAICIAMVIVYPAYTSLQFGKSTFSTTTYTFSQRFDLLDFFVKLFPGSYDTVRPEGLPFVYAGTMALILVPIYFITSRIRWQERMMSGVLLCTFMLCFNVNAIDIIWHGFQKPNWLNYRYSFMFIFLILVMAYKAFDKLRFANYKHVVFSAGAFVVMLMMIQKQDYEWVGNYRTIWLSVLCIAVFTVALWFVYSGKFKAGATAVVAILVCVELFTAGLLNTIDLDKDVVISSRDSYNNYMNKVRPLVEHVQNLDNSPFYRMEKDFHRKTNDPMTLGFYGISNSTSTLNKPVINMLHRYGYASKSHWTEYRGTSPVSDSLIGIKYVIADNKLLDDVWTELLYDSKNDYYVYQNPYALSLAFASHANVTDFEITDYESPFELANALTTALTGSSETLPIYNKLKLVSTDFENIKTGFTSEHRKYSKKDETASARIEYTVAVKAGVPVYMYVPTDYPKECTLRVDGVIKGNYMGNKTDHVQYLGIFDEDKDIIVSLELKEDPIYIRTNEDYFFWLDTDLFKETFNTLGYGNLDITTFEEDYIEGTVSVPENMGILYTTIVFDEGWIVTVDGEEKELIRTNDALLAVAIEPGEHEVTFRYRPKCYTVGSTISLLGLAAFGGAIVYDELRKRRELKLWAKANHIF
ncbi:MAG: hypothetical protein E7618_06305 [Ruminococcaceae bacterium]|nr:hypothetical protein [Oscillospiraceae bacterium]